MRVIYLKHSGFIVDLDKLVLVFDFYLDPDQVLTRYEHCGKPVVFFVSHKHCDHWNPDILHFRNSVPSHYLLADELRSELAQLDAHSDRQHNIHFLSPSHRLEDERLVALGLRSILTLPSTDSGIAFYLQLEDFSLYHAGDLNDWDWQDGQSDLVERYYRDALNKLRETLTEDEEPQLAFVPVDSRLGETALCGACIFLEYFKPQFLFPMHMHGGEHLPAKLQGLVDERGLSCKILGMLTPGEFVEV